jgi:hypothetical protein
MNLIKILNQTGKKRTGSYATEIPKSGSGSGILFLRQSWNRLPESVRAEDRLEPLKRKLKGLAA